MAIALDHWILRVNDAAASVEFYTFDQRELRDNRSIASPTRASPGSITFQ